MTGLRPGDVAEIPIALWSEEEVQRFRDEWRELQVQFIDEPSAAVAGAKRLVTEAVEALSRSLLAQQDQLDPRHQATDPDTEALRVAMRRYREFLDRVLAPEPTPSRFVEVDAFDARVPVRGAGVARPFAQARRGGSAGGVCGRTGAPTVDFIG